MTTATKSALANESARQRLHALTAEGDRLRLEAAELQDQLGNALLSGDDPARTKEQVARVAARQAELEILRPKLEDMAAREERAGLKREFEEAVGRRRDLEIQIAAAAQAVRDAYDVVAATETVHFGLKNRSDGRYEADLRLRRHREEYPDIDEATL